MYIQIPIATSLAALASRFLIITNALGMVGLAAIGLAFIVVVAPVACPESAHNQRRINVRTFCLLVFALVALSVSASAQNTPAPCSPANLQYTYQLLGCYNSVDCSSGYECVTMRTATDVVYGTTCSVEPVYYCSYPFPGGPNASNERKDHAKAVLASIRARNRQRAS